MGCQLRRCCCRPRGPDNPWGDVFPHLCKHCDTLFHDGKMTLEQVRFEVVRILRAHAAKLEQAAQHASRRARALEQKERGK